LNLAPQRCAATIAGRARCQADDAATSPRHADNAGALDFSDYGAISESAINRRLFISVNILLPLYRWRRAEKRAISFEYAFAPSAPR